MNRSHCHVYANLACGGHNFAAVRAPGVTSNGLRGGGACSLTSLKRRGQVKNFHYCSDLWASFSRQPGRYPRLWRKRAKNLKSWLVKRARLFVFLARLLFQPVHGLLLLAAGRSGLVGEVVSCGVDLSRVQKATAKEKKKAPAKINQSANRWRSTMGETWFSPILSGHEFHLER